MKRLNVALTFYASRARLGSAWTNGAVQNAYFLHLLLRRCPNVAHLYWLNLGEDAELPPGLLIADHTIRLVRPGELRERLDVVIELSAQLDEALATRLSGQGTKLVSLRVGNDFVIDMERQIFKREGGLPFTGARYDAVWTLPQHERTCRDYFGVTLRCPVHILPSIWTPYFIEQVARSPELAGKLGYQPGVRGKRISIFEPNLNVLKTSHYPMLACEVLYRSRPELIEHVYVTCADELMCHPLFVRFANKLDIVTRGICTFEKRYPIPWFLAEYTDIVLSHQWENELNYLYYDVTHAGYPLVHDSAMLREYGYFYQPFDAQDGARALLRALETHDAERPAYLARQTGMLEKASALNEHNVAQYAAALDQLVHP
jgi:hypothetical protein